MLVDPNTGMPIGTDKSLLSDLGDSSPSAFVSTMWNARRVSNTIIHGGTAGRIARNFGDGMPAWRATSSIGTGGFVEGGLSQTLAPSHWRRLTRPANIDPAFYGEDSKIYTPFGMMAKEGNKAFKYAMKKSPNMAARMSQSFGGETGSPFAAGTLGRIHTMSNINRMSGAKALKSSNNIESAIRDINPDYYAKTFQPGMLAGLSQESIGVDASKYALSSGVGSTMSSGFLSARVGGYMQGTQAAFAERAGTSGATAAARSVIEEGSHFSTGFEKGVSALGEGSKFAEFAGSGALGGVLRGVSGVGEVMLVHDLAQMAGKMIGHGLNLMSDAGTSIIGSTNKDVMGMGFKDNSVAATSRARGVMAIQSSKLNMRSALGSEASQLAAHFG